ncbi:hypothetical protein JCM39194_07610 [Desulfotomaculum varum]
MKSKINWKFILSAVGFLFIGASMIYPQERWLIITGALLFVFGMVKKPRQRK